MSETPLSSEAALRAWFDRDVQPLLQQHAAAAERLAKYGLYPIGVFLLLMLCFIATVIAERLWPALIVLAVAIPAAAVCGARVPVYQAGGTAFRALFKQRVVSRIVAEILPGASYDPDLRLARSVLDASGLVDDDVAYSGDDLVRGTIGRTPFALGDVRAGSAHRSAVRGVFQGLVFHAEFNRSLSGRTVACPQGESPATVPLNRDLAPTTLESPEFEALFSVYASDPVEARYVLTPKTMERLVALRHLVGRKLYAAFDHRRVYVAVDNGSGAFEALAFGGEKAWSEIRGYAALFDTARAIVEELELNTRIWTKGFAPEDEQRAAAVSEPSAWTHVAEMGAWAFQVHPSVPFNVKDPPAPPAHTRVERRPAGGIVARYPTAWGVLFVLLVLTMVAGIASVDPGWWPAHPELGRLGPLALWIRTVIGPASLLGASVAGTALYHARVRARWLEAGPEGARTGRFGRALSYPRARIQRVFAAEDFVMAQIEGSWIPALFSPRLGAHGAALWLAAEIDKALNGVSR